MPASSEPSRSLPSPIARGVGLARLVLIVLFLTILSTSLLPVRLLDTAWQLRVGWALINASPFPLIGLVLLHVAASLDLQDPLLLQRRRLAARLERARSSAPPASPWALVVPILITFGNSVNRRKPKTNSGGDGLVGWNSRGLCLLARAGPPAIAAHQPAGSNLPAGSIHRHRQAGTLTCQPGGLLVTPHR